MLTAVLIIAGWGVAYVALRQTVKKCCEEFRHEFQDQINTLHARVRLLDRAVATRQATALPFVAPKAEFSDARPAPPIAWPTPATSDEVPPETMAVIAETVTGFLGKKVRICSVKRLPAPGISAPTPADGAEPWAQQGRVLVQTSHEPVHGRAHAAPAPLSPTSLRGVVLETTDIN